MEIDDYINKIVQIVYDNLPVEDGWDKFTVKIVCVSLMSILNFHYYTQDGKRISFEADFSDIEAMFMELRDSMYKLSPENGAWFTCKIEVKNGGKFTCEYNYDDKPEFIIWPSKEKFINDLEKYPRKIIPEWLKRIINKK